jgi:hypothetical protein
VTTSNLRYIAQRKVFASKKGNAIKQEVVIRITEPYIVQQGDVKFPADGIISGCKVEIEGLDEPGFSVYGMDSLQAINIASNIEPLLQRLSEDYDFFWISGEPYFEEK